MHKYIIMGPQGSGKGTQAKVLAKRLDLVHISVGDIFRWHVQMHTKLAARVRRTIEAGQLVPDELVEQVIRDRLQEHDWNYGFILDGFPRSTQQAAFFLESYDVDAVVYIDVPDEVVRERALARRQCAECGQDYNVLHNPPQTEGVCDVCGGPLVRRADDNEEALARRLRDFSATTKPAIDLFEAKELVVHVDGRGSIDDVAAAIADQLNLPDAPGDST